MRWSLVAGLIGFLLVELASLTPIARIASVSVTPTLRGAPNQAALDWALSTRDPYLDVETVRGFRDVVLAGRPLPEAESLALYLREKLWVTRQGDSLVLSVRARDGELARRAAEFFGGRLQYFTRRPHGAMAAPRIEWLAFRSYELRRLAGLTPLADATAPPPLLTNEERASLAAVDHALAAELEAVDDELRFWTAPVRPAQLTDAVLGPVTVRAHRRFGSWPGHGVAIAVGVTLFGMALLVARILRGGARAWTAAVAIATAAVPIAAAAVVGAMGFRSRAEIPIERHGQGGDELLPTTFLRAPDRFLDRERFPELWPPERVEASMGAPHDLRSFQLPAELAFRAASPGIAVEVVRRDAMQAEKDAVLWSHRVAEALRRVGGLARFRERAALPQTIRAAEGRIRFHETMLSRGGLTADLEKLHRDKRAEDLRIAEDARRRMAAMDASPLQVDIVRVHGSVTTAPSWRGARRSGTAAVVMGMLVVLAVLFARAATERRNP